MEETEYIMLIEWLCQQFYYNAMLSHAKQACEIYPTSNHLRIILSVAYILNGKTHEALKEISNFNNQPEMMLSTLLIQSSAQNFSGTLETAMVEQIDLQIKEERRKATSVALSQAALVLFLFRKFEKAKDYNDRAYKLNSSNIDIVLIKGWIELYLLQEGRSEKAVDYFETILKNNEKHISAQLGSAKYKQLQSNHEAAIAILNSLIVRYPKLSVPLVEKLENQLGMKDWEQVLETGRRILIIEPNNLNAIKANSVVTLCRHGDYREGLRHVQLFFRNLILAEPKSIELLISNIQLFSRITGRDMGILSELSRVMEKMLQQSPRNGDLMVELGNLYIYLGKIKEAEQSFRNAARIDESSFSALMGLAHCQLLNTLLDALDLARQQVNFLMEIQPNSISPELLFMSAKLCGNDGKKAMHYLDMAGKMLLKNCEHIPYGYEYLKKLNPDLCLDIVKERLNYSLGNDNTGKEDKLVGNMNRQLTLTLLEKLTEACPGLGPALLMLSEVQMQSGNLAAALETLKNLLDFVDPSNAEGHLLMAQILARQGRLDLASQSLEVGLSYNFKVRENPLYHLIIGMVQKENGNLEGSIESYQTAMLLAGLKPGGDSKDVTKISLIYKAPLYLELITAYSKLKRFDEALALMEKAKSELAETVEEGKIIIGNAELCIEMGDWDKAIDYLTKILPDEPYYLQAHTKLAEIYLNYRKDRQAFAKCFRELVEHCPGSKTYSMLGDAYVSIQEPERAIEAYEEALKQNPTDKISIANKLGKALVTTHQYNKAINYYKEITNQDSCKPLKLDLAKLFMKMKQYDKAESTLVQELHDSRGETDLQKLERRGQQLILLAKVREKAGNMKLAFATLKEAKENQIRYIQRAVTAPNIINQKHALAEVCLTIADQASSLRDYNQAIIHYNEALNHKPADTTALLSLAKLYMQMNNLEQCAQSCAALLTADPDNEAASVMLADLAFRKIDFEAAAFHFRQLLMRRPTYWTALARLIEVCRRTGNMDDLEEWLSRAEAAMGTGNADAGFYYCTGLLDWRMGRLNSALRNFNSARRDPEWGQQAIYNMIEICLDPDDDSSLTNEAFNDDDIDYQDSRTMALNTAYRLLQELNPKGSAHEMLTHRLLGNFFLLATKQKSNIEKALNDCTALASQDALRDHVGPALGIATAHILLKQTPRARNHLKRVSKNVWTFEDAEYLERCWLLLANIYVQSGKHDMANELLRRVLQHNATCVRAHELSGQIAEKDQNYREAAARYRKAWKFGGKTKLLIGYKLAFCHLKAKMYADAIETCNEVLKQDPDYPRIKKDILEKSINNLRT